MISISAAAPLNGSSCSSHVCRAPEIVLENILRLDSDVRHADDDDRLGDCGLGCSPDMDHRAVDLLLGRCMRLLFECFIECYKFWEIFPQISQNLYF